MSGWGSNVREEGVMPLRLKPRRKAETPKTSVRRGAPQDEAASVERELPYHSPLSAVRRRLDTASPAPVARASPRSSAQHPAPAPAPILRDRASQSQSQSRHISPDPSPAGVGGPLQSKFTADVAEYDPVGSQRMVEFENERSKLAHKRWLETQEQCAKASKFRRMKRDEELRAAKERLVEREAQRLREQQVETQHALEEEAWREERLQAAMHEELQRVTALQQKREEVKVAEVQLVRDYEEQLEELRTRERNKELYLCRQEARETMKDSIEENLSLTMESLDTERARLEQERAEKEKFYTDEMMKSMEADRRNAALHAAMELGRTMRVAGVRRADVAHEMGIIHLPQARLG
eukprot:TRINITY_DN27687_c0_g1_i1.p1 TRINITY_DN27687_c0_g1~~TRINITY_DN27687_c0_g1_i1.p1  ORF type:complete len:352 (+),score=107.06 TRINITY_DN27687_c0_g1_i1:81-1136(+)